MNHKLQTSKGFTLVEMIVAIGLFTVILSILTSNFINMTRTQAANLSLIESVDNLNIALEQMSREIRWGGIDFDKSDDSKIVFSYSAPEGNKIVSYEYADEDLDSEYDSIKRCEGIFCANINSKNIKINKFYIQLINASPARVVISFEVSPKNERLKNAAFNMQTTVSLRNF